MMERGFIDGEYQDGEVRGVCFLSGKRGMGKTFELIRLLCSCRGGVLFFDTLAKHFPSGFTPIYDLAALKTFLRGHRGVPFRVLYQPRSGNRMVHFDGVCMIVAAVAKECGGMVLAVDEVDRFTTANTTPPGLHDLVEYGRHCRVAMLCTARKPPQVPRTLTSECLEFRLFRTTESRYVNYWADAIGDDETARQLRILPKYQYLLCRDGEDPQLLSAGKPVRVVS